MMDIKCLLWEKALQEGLDANALQLPEGAIDPGKIHVMMINEAAPKNPDDWFYSAADDPENRRTALGLFNMVGISAQSMQEVLNKGIYITAALKTPKTGYTADPAVMREQLSLLEAEIGLFPKLKLIMLMGDVAAKMINMIVKAQTKKSACPSGAAGRRRHWNNEAFYWGGVRIFPSYIMTGKNLMIEPFKRDIIVQDLRRMSEMLPDCAPR